MTDLTPKRPSEDILNEKWDLCLSNAIVKAGLGVGVGVVGSVVFLRRRAWPVFTGLGFGLGQAYSDCDRHFNPLRIPGQRLVSAREASVTAGKQ